LNDQREPEGSPTGKWAIILPVNSTKTYRLAPGFRGGFFIVRRFVRNGSSYSSTKSSGTILNDQRNPKGGGETPEIQIHME